LPYILLIKQQFVITHTIHKTQIPVLLRQFGLQTHFLSKYIHEKIACSCIFMKHNMLNCSSVEDLCFLFPVEACISMGYDKLLFS